jgi:hypothetical protein
MCPYQIELQGRAVTYLAALEEMPEDAMDDIVGFDFFDDQELRDHPRLRRILMTLVRPKPLFYGALHWSDGCDLVVLDRKVRRDTVGEDDFAGAVVAEPRTIVCTNCQAQLRVLAVDTGQALFSSTLAERMRKHELRTSCTVCAAQLGLPIVELLGQNGAPPGRHLASTMPEVMAGPVATARVRWLAPRRLPAQGSTMWATAVFVLGNDPEVIPGWPATGEHFSVSLTFTDLSAQEAEATIDFVNRELVADCLHEKAVFLVMAGPQPIAEARITAMLLET